MELNDSVPGIRSAAIYKMPLINLALSHKMYKASLCHVMELDCDDKLQSRMAVSKARCRYLE